MLSRKYYKAIADLAVTSHDMEDFLITMADYFEADNPRFDKEKFLEASGVNQWVKMDLKN